jgi:16S rRNA (adenine1518-N6/adenine1519-N6)-dimethyltransferase
MSAAGDRNRPPRPHALRRYGQNHLVDKNILHAIVDQAAVGPDDIVLEVGAAGGLLTRPVLEQARLVHAFEIDRRWLPPLEELAAADPRLVLHAGDALKSDLTALDPPPTALVANLAYNIAIPLIMTTIAELGSVRRWAVMVQRELGERLFAVPSTKAYSAVSVLTQLACRLEKVRPVPASAFRPRPRVESSFVTFVRRDADPSDPGSSDTAGGPDAEAADTAPGPAEYAAVSHLVRLAFGQRRKTLVNSLSGAAHAGASLSRDGVRGALRELALGEAARPEELTPPQWRVFAAVLGAGAAAGPAA